MAVKTKSKTLNDLNPDLLAQAIAEALTGLLSGFPPNSGERFVLWPEVHERTGRTYPTIWAWMRAGKFPRSRDVNGRPAWLASEIETWIKSRPVKRLKGD